MNLPLIETQVLFRPSEIGQLMTNSRSKSEILGETAKTRLTEKAIEIRYGRYKDFSNKYTTKGLAVEEQSITTYSLLKGRFFANNKVRVKNDFFTGEIDLPWIDSNGKTVAITDVKSSYSVHTFWSALKEVNKAYVHQGCGYLDLFPDAEKYHIAHLLVDNTDDAVLNELYRESYKWENGDVPSWRSIEVIKNHIFTSESFDRIIKMHGVHIQSEKDQKAFDSFIEIPIEQRLIEHTFLRSDLESEIQEVKERMAVCREWLFENFNIKHIEK